MGSYRDEEPVRQLQEPESHPAYHKQLAKANIKMTKKIRIAHVIHAHTLNVITLMLSGFGLGEAGQMYATFNLVITKSLFQIDP